MLESDFTAYGATVNPIQEPIFGYRAISQKHCILTMRSSSNTYAFIVFLILNPARKLSLHCNNCGPKLHDQKNPGLLLLAASMSAHAALDPHQVRQLAADDSSDKVAAIRQLTQTADPDAVRVLKALWPKTACFWPATRCSIVDGDQAFDAASGQKLKTPANPESVTVNNRIRGELASALAALKLFDADAGIRLASAQKLQSQVTPEMAPLLARCAGQGKRRPDQGLLDAGLCSGQFAQRRSRRPPCCGQGAG